MSKKKPEFIKTIGQLIHWQYAKLIAEARCGKRDEFALVMSEFKKLESGSKKMSSILRDNKKLLYSEKKCIYCGSEDKIQLDHIIPLSKGGPDSLDNLVYSCRDCNLSKSNKDLTKWYDEEEYSNLIPSLVFAKYLKLLYEAHSNNGTLDLKDCELNFEAISDIFNKK